MSDEQYRPAEQITTGHEIRSQSGSWSGVQAVDPEGVPDAPILFDLDDGTWSLAWTGSEVMSRPRGAASAPAGGQS